MREDELIKETERVEAAKERARNEIMRITKERDAAIIEAEKLKSEIIEQAEITARIESERIEEEIQKAAEESARLEAARIEAEIVR